MPTFPISGLLDDFNRANEGPPPTGWSNFSTTGLKVLTNQLVPDPDDGTYRDVIYNTASPDSDWEWWITVVALGTSPIVGMQSLTVSNLGNGYEVVFVGTNDTRIRRLDSGVPTQLGATISYTLQAGDQIGIRKLDSTISAWANGAELGNRTDATYSETSKCVVHNFASTGGFKGDNFGGGNPYFEKSNGGTLTLSGVLTKAHTIVKAIAGAITFSSTVVTKLVFTKALAGALTFAGTINRKTTKGLSGSLSFLGALITNFTFSKALAGTLTFSSTLTRKTTKQLSGILSFIGKILTPWVSSQDPSSTSWSNVSDPSSSPWTDVSDPSSSDWEDS